MPRFHPESWSCAARVLAICAVLLSSGWSMAAAAETTFYVSPTGNDRWSGRLPQPSADGRDGPFATPARALAAARGGGPATVRLGGGTYRLSAPLVVDGSLSGLRLTAAEGQQPVLSGGEMVGGARMANGLLSAPLAREPGLDVAIGGSGGGQRLDAARSGDFDPGDPRSGWFPAKAVQSNAKSPGSKRQMQVPPGVLKSGWAGPGVRAQALDRERLSDDLLGVVSADPNGLLTLGGDGQYPYRDGSTVRLLGHPDFLTRPGEFAWDAKARRLLVKPPTGFDSGRAELVVARTATLLRLDNARNVTVEGLTFTDVPWDGCAVLAKGGSGLRIAGNRFALVGTAVTLDGAARSEVSRNRMEHLGRSGIFLAPGSSDNRILANRISDVGEVRFFGGGVMAAGIRNTLIAHNDIRRAARYGISVKNWNPQTVNSDNVIEFNRIRDTARQTADAGAIEMLGRSGNDTRSIVRFNDIRDTGGLATDAQGRWLVRYKGFGIYLDDMTSGVTVQGNLLENTGMAAIFLHGGDNNRVSDNITVMTDRKDRFLRLEWVPSAGRNGLMHGNVANGNVVAGPAPNEQVVVSLTGGDYKVEDTQLESSAPPAASAGMASTARAAAPPAGGRLLDRLLAMKELPLDRVGPEGMR
ncbi:right-handed parallel beta-helix repeat-containing protein [Azospirillum humicireducens]|uniref:Right-handed parallel beta-helix repeat-containing protein n=1 Tax=Azospirillum humicireducens TaxID=1226968 RepID=A0A160JD48_9PROT|nr:right-handed parallel beta-helix repeat-containing protein [Azospirillum humicireducens]ANC90595.1 right-handed parallel beta-helix repeat-containing protein [Azospirillum humicireducens]